MVRQWCRHLHHHCLQTSNLLWPELPLVHSNQRLHSSLHLTLHVKTILRMESLHRRHNVSRMRLLLARSVKQLAIKYVQVWNNQLSAVCCIIFHAFILYCVCALCDLTFTSELFMLGWWVVLLNNCILLNQQSVMLLLYRIKPRHWVCKQPHHCICKPAYFNLVPVPSQDKVDGCGRKGIRCKYGGWWRWVAD